LSSDYVVSLSSSFDEKSSVTGLSSSSTANSLDSVLLVGLVHRNKLCSILTGWGTVTVLLATPTASSAVK